MKTTGAEFSKFYSDPVMWPKGNYHDDDDITVNGKDNAELDSVSDNAVVEFTCGVVFNGNNEELNSFPSYFKKWKKAQTTDFLTIEVPKTATATVTAWLKGQGCKVR